MIRQLLAIAFVYVCLAPAALASPAALLTPGWGRAITCHAADERSRPFRAQGPRVRWRELQEKALFACRQSGARGCRVLGCK